MADTAPGAIPSPPTNPEVAPFHEAANRGKLLVGRCRACGEAHFYPRRLCPFCAGETEWQEAAGTGTIYSYAVLSRAKPPYAQAYVTLDEGPTMLTRIVDCPFEELAVGKRVRVVFRPAENGQAIPFFAPA
jgi:uncharacterized OB-fold protein